MARGLSDQFMTNLTGKNRQITFDLTAVLDLVQHDSSLCLEIREDYINIYYRGGNMMKLAEKKGQYSIRFDTKYFKYLANPATTNTVQTITTKKAITQSDVDDYIKIIPFIKHSMDLYFGAHPKNEREFQQLLARENNRKGVAKGTDYFIADIEYAEGDSRFDMIAIKWPSTIPDRKNKRVGLSFIEMKYGDRAQKNSAGIVDHIDKLAKYLNSEPNVLLNLKQEMMQVFNQKLELGLVDNQNKIVGFNDNPPEFIFVLANHDAQSTILKTELQKVHSDPAYQQLPFDIKIAVSSYMGYGLYENHVHSLDDFITDLQRVI